MSIIKLAMTSALITGAFVAGITLASIAKNENIINKIKKMTIRKNNSASMK